MSEMVKAMALALRKGPPQVACCTSCGEPLVSTLLIPYKEFVCVKCGLTLGFVEPNGKEETPELLAQIEANNKVWDDATENESIGTEAALAWLKARGGEEDGSENV